MFLLLRSRECTVRYRIDRIMGSFPKEIRDEFCVKDDELGAMTDPTIILMNYRLCLLGEKVKALEAAQAVKA